MKKKKLGFRVQPDWEGRESSGRNGEGHGRRASKKVKQNWWILL